MKTTVLFRMIVLVAMVFAGISNATLEFRRVLFRSHKTITSLLMKKQ